MYQLIWLREGKIKCKEISKSRYQSVEGGSDGLPLSEFSFVVPWRRASQRGLE
jgi:hypothetical protein